MNQCLYTYVNVFLIGVPNIVMKFHNFDIFLQNLSYALAFRVSHVLYIEQVHTV